MFNKVFISHAKEDTASALKLFDFLTSNHYDPWLDKKNLLPGQLWDTEIMKALKNADFIVLLLSKTSIEKRGYIQKEFKRALDFFEEKLKTDIYLIPCKIDDCEVPEQFIEFQWVELSEPNAFEKILDALNHQRKKYENDIAFNKKEYRLINNGFKLFITGVQGIGKTMISKRLQSMLKNNEMLQIVDVDSLKDGFRKEIQIRKEKLHERNMCFRDIQWFYEEESLLESVLETSYNLGVEGIEKQSEYIFPRLMNALERHAEKGIPTIIEGLNIPIDKLVEYYREKKASDSDFNLSSIVIVNICVSSDKVLEQHIKSYVNDRQLTGEEREKQNNDLNKLWELGQYFEKKTEKLIRANPDMWIRNIDNSGIRDEDKDIAIKEIIQLIVDSGNFVDL